VRSRAPFVEDQPNWARRIEALGVGPRAIPFRKLTADLLADAIRQATSDTAMHQRASDLGAQIRSEDGVGTTVDLFMSFVCRGHDSSSEDAAALALVGWYLMWKKQVMRPRFPAPF